MTALRKTGDRLVPVLAGSARDQSQITNLNS